MLTDVDASAALAGDKDYKLADAQGLYLFVTRAGFKSWRMKYRYGGKEKRLTFGAYPEVSLEEARARRDQARQLLRENIDPGVEKQRFRAGPAGEEAETPSLPFAVGAPTLSDAPVPTSPPAVVTPSPAQGPEMVDEPEDLPVAPAQDATLDQPAPAVSVGRDEAALPVEPPAPVGDPAPPQQPTVAEAPRVQPEPSSAASPPPPLRPAARPAFPPPPRAERPAPPPEPPAPSPVERLVEEPLEPVRSVSPPPPPVATPPIVPQEPPPPEVPPTVEPVPELSGSRALSLLKQAERAAETAASQSRAAKRVAYGVLALFAVLALALGWWMMSGRSTQSRVARADPASVAPTIATASAPLAPAAATAPGSSAAAPATSPAPGTSTPPSTTSGPPADSPPIGAAASPGGDAAASPAAAAPSTSPTPSRAESAATTARGDAPAVRTHRAHRHHRHRIRKHRRHGSRAYGRHSSRSAPFYASTPRHRLSPAATGSSVQEGNHVITVEGSRGETIDPALDRAGRAALCLRAAYSASPGCAAVR